MFFAQKHSKIFLFFILISFSVNLLFAGGKKDKAPVTPSPSTQTETAGATESTPITTEGSTKLPGTGNKKGYFGKVDESILNDVENGSPSSIKSAMSRFRKNEADYIESEKVLISVAASIMEIVWETQKVDWTVYQPETSNPYTGAVKSARSGVFDSSTGNSDFLSTILPCLVLFTAIKTNDKLLNQCEASVKLALSKKPDSVLANYIAGVLYEKKGDYKTSEQYLKKAYETSSDTLQICIAYSRILSHNGNNELASSVVKSVSSSQINDIQVLKQSAYIAYKNNELDQAEDYVARVLQQTPNDLEFVLFRAKIFIQKKDYIHAVSLLDMYARQDDKNLDYLILRAKVQLDWSKNVSAATETVEKALKLYPDSEDALMMAARISSMTDSPVAGKYADDLAGIVLKKNPENTTALLYALDGLIQRKNWNEAYEISSQLIKKVSGDAEIIKRHVNVCVKCGKKNEALDVAQKAYNADKTNETIIETYVYAYCQVNSRDSSLNLINSLMAQTNSQHVKSYLYYQRSFLQRTEESVLADLRSSLMADSRNSDSLFRLYEIYFEKKDYKKAQYYLKQVVAINPNDSSLKKINEALTQLIN